MIRSLGIYFHFDPLIRRILVSYSTSEKVDQASDMSSYLHDVALNVTVLSDDAEAPLIGSWKIVFWIVIFIVSIIQVFTWTPY